MLNKRILVLMFLLLFLPLVGCLTPSNQAPILTSSPVTTATVGVLYTYDVNAKDPDGDTLTYSLAVKPGGMTINSATGVINWTPVSTQIGDNPVTVKVSDGTLSITQSFKIKVGTLPPVNQAPVIISTPVATATVGITYFYVVNATDPDNDVLTYSLTAYPPGMTISSASGLIWWIPTPAQVGNNLVTVMVSDGVLIDIQGFTIVVSKPTIPVETYTITASAGSGGTISPLGDVTVSKGANISFTITPNTNYVIDKVLVDGASVGAISTYTFNNVGKDHTIHAIFSVIEPEPEIELTGIEVDPKTMTLFVGESKAIKSVTATYEIKGLEVPVLPGDCTYLSTDEAVAIVEKGNFGEVTVIAEGVGTATIIVNYGGKTDTVAVTVNEVVDSAIVYRALCVGVGDYQNYGPDTGDLLGPPYDVDRMVDVLNQCKFGLDEVVFLTPVPLKNLNATKTNIISGIASTFSGADDNDISYFYFSGHGAYGGSFTTSYICPTDADGSIGSFISVDELESYLSSIQGTKVVILDSCFSGGFIGKGKEEIIISKEELISFNDEIINVFSQAEYKGLLTTNQYKVLTSCHHDQVCYEILPVVDDPFGVFTMALCDGCGYSGNYLADINSDNKVSLQEAHLYIKDWVFSYGVIQDVQVYPDDSSYPIVEY